MRNVDVESNSSTGSHRPLRKDGRGGGYAFYYTEGERKSKWTPWLIPVIVLVNVTVFIVVMLVNNCPKKRNGGGRCVASFLGPFSFQPLRENPLLGPSSSTLLKLGALDWYKVVHQHQGWRLCSCIWLHAGLIHLIANMLSLLFIGIRLELQFGFIRIGIIYLLSGFGGSVLSSLFTKNSISVGASGALFGILGAMLSELITNWTIYSNKAAALVTLTIIIAINLVVGIVPYVDNFAHIGGFLTGFFLGFILLVRPHYGWLVQPRPPPTQTDSSIRSKYMVYQYILMVISLTLLVAGFVIGLVMLFRGKTGSDNCHWCHYLSCVPTSSWDCGS
ncbi:unnamed protein product [Victoria cruziana]